MIRRVSLSAGALLISTPIAAQDVQLDAEAGEALFGRQCVVCHVIENDEGEVVAGSSAGIGPNLFGVVGATPGTQENYDYSSALVAYGEMGVVWQEGNFVSFVQDPTGHLREALDNPRARSKMSYRLRDEEEARSIFAYLAMFTPEEEAESAAMDQ